MKRYICILFLFAFSACTEAVLPEYSPVLVVDGWIENGRPPIVIVTSSVPVSTEHRTLESLADNMIRWATVSIHDGEREVFLTGKMNTDYYPPYVYTTSMMSGEVGKTYTLKVKYGGMEVEAETKIPEPVGLSYIRAEKARKNAYVLLAGFEDNESTKDYYKFFTKVMGRDSVYRSSFMGLIDDVTLDEGVNDLQVFNGLNLSALQKDTLMYFNAGDKVAVKFCTLGEKEFQYWEDYDDVASLSRNALFPVTKKIRSNIKGGLGYWAGYGSTYYYIGCE